MLCLQDKLFPLIFHYRQMHIYMHNSEQIEVSTHVLYVEWFLIKYCMQPTEFKTTMIQASLPAPYLGISYCTGCISGHWAFQARTGRCLWVAVMALAMSMNASKLETTQLKPGDNETHAVYCNQLSCLIHEKIVPQSSSRRYIYTCTVVSRKRAHGWCTLPWTQTGRGGNIWAIILCTIY